MQRQNILLLLLVASISGALAFAPQFGVYSGPANGAMTTISSGVAGVDTVSNSPLSNAGSVIVSVVQEGETVVRQGVINWDNPAEAIGGAITLLYIGFSIFAGIKYVVKDGYRPKL
jgi:hypothetical protein